MTFALPGLFVIAAEDPGQCEFCGKTDELRPYGPNGENVCFKCAMKDEKAAKKQFQKRLDSCSFSRKLDAIFEADEPQYLFDLEAPPKVPFQIGRITEHRPDIVFILYRTVDGKEHETAWWGTDKLVKQLFGYWKSVRKDIPKHGQLWGWIEKNFRGPYPPSSMF